MKEAKERNTGFSSVFAAHGCVWTGASAPYPRLPPAQLSLLILSSEFFFYAGPDAVITFGADRFAAFPLSSHAAY